MNRPPPGDIQRPAPPRRPPRPVRGCDMKTLPLTPAEAFLLSRIDGFVAESELAAMTGVPPAAIAPVLEKLAALGAIELDGFHPPAASPAREAPEPLAKSSTEAFVDLEPERCARIRQRFAMLELATHYEFLGVDAAATKRAVKSAYYAIAPEYHPDKYFRRNLGPYRAMIEAIFARLTQAHDVLVSNEQRAEYDAMLASPPRGFGADAPSREPAPNAPIDAPIATAELAPSPRLFPSNIPTRAPLGEASASTGASPSLAPGLRVTLTADELAASDASRREALARRMGSSIRPRAPRPEAAADPAPPGPALEAPDLGRARYEAVRLEAQKREISRLRGKANDAVAKGEFRGAALALRQALGLAPDDPTLQRECDVMQRRADAAEADVNWKQGEYDADQGRWIEAALSFAKVCAGRPDDARAHERAAAALIKSGGNPRRAVEFARRGVELAPKGFDAHLTLTRAYLAAGLEVSARGELERATALLPTDPRLKEVAAELTRAEKAKKVS